MTTKDEALRLALEALEKAENDAAYFQTVNGDQVDAAITACREALAQPVGERGKPVAWQPIETAPKDNKQRLYLARFDETGRLAELDFDGLWGYWQESWEMSHINGYCWMSANGIEEPTHWAYQDEPLPTTPQPAAQPAGEQQEPVAWQPIETAPKDGTLIVARGNNHGNEELGQHHCIACWYGGVWAEASDWNPTSHLTYLTHWIPLPPTPGDTAPQPAAQPSEWIGLSDEEIFSIACCGNEGNSFGDLHWQDDTLGFVKAIEARLREKNAGKLFEGSLFFHEAKNSSNKLAPWLSAALEDPNSCSEFKAAIEWWFQSGITDKKHWPEAGKPVGINGLTHEEESATASVMGLVGKPAAVCEECDSTGRVHGSQTSFDCPVCNDKDQDSHTMCKPDAMKIAGIVGIKFSPEQFSGVLTAEIAEFELEAFAALYRQAILASQAASVTSASKVGGQS